VPQNALVSTAATCFLVVVAAGFQVHADSTQQAVTSVFDGVFTAEQSARGEAQYLETCKRCHKEDLTGDPGEEVPPLVGGKFLAEWAGWTVGDLFEFSTAKMPPKRKDRLELSGQHYADILAYILERNGFPAGEAELLPTLEPLFEIEMSPSK
jgi:S-disulfanyl-L-cysteine oxidoreductase SoxD